MRFPDRHRGGRRVIPRGGRRVLHDRHGAAVLNSSDPAGQRGGDRALRVLGLLDGLPGPAVVHGLRAQVAAGIGKAPQTIGPQQLGHGVVPTQQRFPHGGEKCSAPSDGDHRGQGIGESAVPFQLLEQVSKRPTREPVSVKILSRPTVRHFAQEAFSLTRGNVLGRTHPRRPGTPSLEQGGRCVFTTRGFFGTPPGCLNTRVGVAGGTAHPAQPLGVRVIITDNAHPFSCRQLQQGVEACVGAKHNLSGAAVLSCTQSGSHCGLFVQP